MILADSHLGEGRIDNWVIDSSVHLVVGSAVLVTMLAATVYLVRLAWQGGEVDSTARLLLGVAQATLVVQVLIGIKLLDQGQGIVQLYIHYVGGALPLGLFLAAGWFAWRDALRYTRLLSALTGAASLVARPRPDDSRL